MNRRGFLGLLAGAATGFVLDPEQLLWRPGAKTIFLPSLAEPEFFGPVNSFLTPDVITREALKVLSHQIGIVRLVERSYDASGLGCTVAVRLPRGFKDYVGSFDPARAVR